MYANLMVTLKDGEQLWAWQVSFPNNGGVLVHLDDPEDTSSYYKPAGERLLEVGEVASIAADF